jgi:hypothetical protein
VKKIRVERIYGAVKLHIFDFGVTVDQKFVFKSCSCVRNITIEFNALFKSGLGIEIRQLHAEILIINPEKS